MTLVTMAVEKYSWNLMVARKPGDLDDSYFSSNMVSLVETQTVDTAFQIEVQIYIWDVTESLKSKQLFTALVDNSRQFVHSVKCLGKYTNKYWILF